jgi:hypothetical protein
MIEQRIRTSLSNLTILSLLIGLFSYPFTSSIIVLFGLPSTLSNFVLKILISIIYVFYFVKTFKYKGKLRSVNLALFFLLMLYSVRILVDIFIYNIQYQYNSQFYIISYFFLLTLLPVVSVLKSGRFLDIKKFNRIVMYQILIINIFYIIVSLYLGKDLIESFAGRLTVVKTEGSAISVINPITIGLNGTISIIYGLFKLLFFKLKFKNKLFCYAMIILGLVNLLLGASRGPLIILLLLIFIIIFKYFKNNKINPTFLMKVILFSFTVGFIFILALPSLSEIDFFLLERIIFLFDGSDGPEIRNYILDSAINDFINNPILGSHILDTRYNSFPHNALINTLMSCGVIGGFILIFSFRTYIKNLYYTIRNTNKPEGQLFFFYISPLILIGMTSGSLIFLPEFWISLSILSIRNVF